jgi:bla regulator protein BlaR1
MTTRLVLSNIASFGLQVTVLVAAGAALARAFRIDEPRAMLAYWQTLLLACLVLPLCQPWNTVIPPALATPTITATGSAPASAGAVAAVESRSVVIWPIADLVLIGLAAGIAARALWLTIGAYGLRRLRRDASPLDPLPESVRNAVERIGARAGVYVSDRVSGPITFGLFRPVVVFPPSVSAMPPHVQEAIAFHELLHVQRRDWLYEILEEAVRSVLWFQPAIWWLIGRIRLTREQVVDQAAIRLTDSRERYVEALLAVALAGSPAAFTPASPFLRRHLLKKRVARILQESTMTTRRLIASLTASAAALALAATFAVQSFPLQAQGRETADTGEPIQLVKGGEHLMHGERPEYPRRAIEQKIQGDVVVEMTLDDRGEVSDARVLSGPEELRKATLEAVLQWHYSPSAISSTVTQATLRFHLPTAGFEKAEFSGKVYVARSLDGMLPAWALPARAEAYLMDIVTTLQDPSTTDTQRAELKAKHLEMQMLVEKIRAEYKEPLDVELTHESDESKPELSVRGVVKLVESERALEQTFEGTPPLVDVRTERVSEATAKELLAQAGVAVGDSITEETAKRIRQVALEMDEHFRVEFQKGHKGGLTLTILAR